MGVIDRVVVQPVLWIAYISLPLLSGPLSSYPSFRTPVNSIFRQSWFYDYLIYFIGGMVLSSLAVLPYIMLLGSVESFIKSDDHHWWLSLFVAFLWEGVVVKLLGITTTFTLVFGFCILFFICCEYSYFPIWLCLVLSYLLIKLFTQSMIVALKNRRSCQLLSVVASVLIGILVSSNANKYLAVIPLGVGFILTIPDFDFEPDVKFKLRFTSFVTCNMDEKSVEKLLDSKHCKMLCCNEMMPSLADLESPVFSCFVKREDRQYCDSTVNPRYEIGLGSVTTSSNEHQIDVVVSTPRCGIKKMTMRNTALSRYNLHNSAGFWRDNPRLGILNHGEVKTHCISTDEWIKCCGLVEFIFASFDHHGEVQYCN